MNREQRRGRSIAMSDAELDRFLSEQRVCRLASISRDGRPHNTPLWFLWSAGTFWIYSLVSSRRWHDLAHDPTVSIVVDAGSDYRSLHGAEIVGECTPVGPVPRPGDGSSVGLDDIEAAYLAKYRADPSSAHDGRHAWLRVSPDSVVSWDFRKL